jgi:predicted peptidase
MRRRFAAVAAAAVVAWCVVPLRAAEQPGQHAETFEKQVPVRFDYLLFLPQDYGKDSAKKWPLIVFLHGSGERGTDVNLVKKHGPPKIVENKPDFPFVVVSPQCPPVKSWNPFELNALLDDVLAKYHIDKDRVYLTGLSMGGFGTWAWAMQSADRFAAIAPICGGGDPTMVRRLRDMPIWVFHGGADPTVPVERSRTLVEGLKEAGNTKVKYTEYPGVGHDSWTKSYDNPELYDWFLSHKRSDRPAGEGERGKRRPKAEAKKG